MALATVARADLSVQNLDWSYATSTNVVDGVLTSGNSQISFATDLENIGSWYVDFSLKSTSSSGSAVLMSTERSAYGASGMTANVEGGNLVLGERIGTTSSYAEYSLAYNADDVYRMAFDGVNGRLYIVNLSDSSYAVTDHAAAVLLTDTFSVWTNGGKEQIAVTGFSAVTGDTWSDSEFRAAVKVTVLVPEPATASLSLLALGALALCRRRA